MTRLKHRSSSTKIAMIIILSLVLSSPAFTADRGISVASKGAIPTGNWGTYHALVIGINDYAKWPRLQTAVKDAQVFHQLLIDKYGFEKKNVILRTDKTATRSQIIADLRTIATSMQDNDNLLIYYAGHGQIDDLTGDGYWVPVEGEAKNSATWISNAYLKAVLGSERVKAKNVLVIADSCYSGTMLRGGPSLLPLTDRGYKQKLMKASAKRSRQVISSGGVEPVADGGADGHSLFAYYMIKALRENDREVIDLENLFHTRVWKPVTEIGDQRPNVGRLKTPMDDDGQFVLYNQAWVAEQQQKRAQQAAALKKKRQAEEADQMAAIQAKNQRLELERQKLEMEKQLLATQKELELQKLQLEKQKQDLEYQKMSARLEQLETERNAGTVQQDEPSLAAPLVASVSPSLKTPRIPADSVKIAYFPPATQHAEVGAVIYGTAVWDKEVGAAVFEATKSVKKAKLTYSYVDNSFIRGDIVIVDDILDKESEKRIWKKESFFDKLPEPQISAVVEYGKKIGTDVAILIRSLIDWEVPTTEVFVVDIHSGKVLSEKSKTSFSGRRRTVKKLTQQLLTTYLSERN